MAIPSGGGSEVLKRASIHGNSNAWTALITGVANHIYTVLSITWAEEAGNGWIGKHSNLINHKSGSWMVLGHLLCTEALTPDKPAQSICGQCQDCIKACPTKAISEPFVIDSRLCLAYHTIENRNHDLPNHITQALGTWVAGCDICQDACPWNKKHLKSSNDPDVYPKDWILKLTKEQVLNWNEREWKENLFKAN